VLGLAGLSLRSDGISIDPHLPNGWDSVAFSVQWRGRRVKIRIDRNERRIIAMLEVGEPMILFAGGKPNHLTRSASPPISW
jgi:trehalose/maltose hydrolase-like predicted phosphorylase